MRLREAVLTEATYLPEKLLGSKFYFPSDRGLEKVIRERMEYVEKKRKELKAKEAKK